MLYQLSYFRIMKLEATLRIELRIEDLQSSALPLGYVAIIWSGKRDSNSRPPPWQGDALPTELFPHYEIGGDTQNRTEDRGFAVLGLTTWLCRHNMERKTRLELATPTLAR